MENGYTPPLRLDEKIQTPEMKAFKSIIPYMEPSVGKMAALAVKMMEIKNIMDLFDTEIAVEGGKSRAVMLREMRPYCGEQALRLTELMEKAEEMCKMAELMSALSGEGEGER